MFMRHCHFCTELVQVLQRLVAQKHLRLSLTSPSVQLSLYILFWWCNGMQGSRKLWIFRTNVLSISTHKISTSWTEWLLYYKAAGLMYRLTVFKKTTCCLLIELFVFKSWMYQPKLTKHFSLYSYFLHCMSCWAKMSATNLAWTKGLCVDLS